eukprot:3734855-Rhodomonas_salina.1
MLCNIVVSSGPPSTNFASDEHTVSPGPSACMPRSERAKQNERCDADSMRLPKHLPTAISSQLTVHGSTRHPSNLARHCVSRRTFVRSRARERGT